MSEPTSFINPYHFLPLPAEPAATSVPRQLAEQALKQEVDDSTTAAAQHLRHDRYGSETLDAGTGGAREVPLLSGRVVCKLTTVSACVFGNRHEENVGTAADKKKRWAAKVYNYELGGRPAVSGTTLRGCIGSLMEALSSSSMRVLTSRRMTFRSNFRESRSALGMVIGHGKERTILPLTLPRLRTKVDSATRKVSLEPASEGAAWKALLDAWAKGGTGNGLPLALPIYIGDYHNPKIVNGQIERDRWGWNKRTEHQLEKPLGVLAPCAKRGLDPRSHSSDHRLELWKLRGAQVEFFWDGKAVVPYRASAAIAEKDLSQAFHFAAADRYRQFPLALEASEEASDATLARVDGTEDLEDLVRSGWRLGIIRRLSPPPGDSSVKVPGNKYHELFIPLEPHLELKTRQLRAEPECLIKAARACQAFDEAVEALQESQGNERPLRLLGQEKAGPYWLRAGDLVHFRLGVTDGQAEVASVAVSAIWREDVGELYEYFRRNGLDELLPFSGKRELITPVEQMLGFVQPDATATRSGWRTPPLTAYAGRVRFSSAWFCAEQSADPAAPCLSSGLTHGQLGLPAEGDNDHGWFPLKILSSPKPPCPEFYFCETGDGTPVPRKNLERPVFTQRPRGWKVYLHDPRAIDGTQVQVNDPSLGQRTAYTWETANTTQNRNQKSLVRPVKCKQVFYFHIDFDNLKRSELALLLKALHPCEGFHHKLGYGKPLGLGSVRIDVLGTFFVDRKERYATHKGLLAGEAHRCRYAQVYAVDAAAMPTAPRRYQREQAVDGAEALEIPSASCNANVLAALEAFGDPQVIRGLLSANVVVNYPFVSDMEDELYQWFMNEVVNVQGRREPLGLAGSLAVLPCRR